MYHGHLDSKPGPTSVQFDCIQPIPFIQSLLLSAANVLVHTFVVSVLQRSGFLHSWTSLKTAVHFRCYRRFTLNSTNATLLCYNLPHSQINRLQRIHNSLTRTSATEHAVCQRIRDFFVDALYKSTFTYLLTYLLYSNLFYATRPSYQVTVAYFRPPRTRSETCVHVEI